MTTEFFWAKLKAQYVVAKLIESCRDSVQFKTIFDELKELDNEEWKNLFQKRQNTVAKLVEGCVKWKMDAAQKEMLQIIHKVCDNQNFLRWLIEMPSEKETNSNKKSQFRNNQPSICNAHADKIATPLFKFQSNHLKTNCHW